MNTESVSNDLKAGLRRLRLSPMLDTLPERLLLARQNKMAYQDFLELVFSDEISRRDRISADLKAKAAKLDPSMRLEAWDDTAQVNFDQQLWSDLTTLRFFDDSNNVIIMGPVGESEKRSWPALSATLLAGAAARCCFGEPIS